MSGTNGPLLFSTRPYAYMEEAVANATGFERGAIGRTEFPDGEHYRRIDTPVVNRHVVLLGGTVSDEATLEAFDLATSLVMGGALSLTLVIPYFGYSTMERAVKPGEVVMAKNRALMFSAIPRASEGDRIVMLDLHSEGLPYYFEGSLRPVHLYAKPLIKAAARRLAGEGRDFVLACTDAGRAKWVESLANDMAVRPAFVFKRRLSGAETSVSAVSAQVEGQHVIIYDDMIRTGGSLIQAAASYREAGAVRVSAISTHGVFPEGAVAKIQSSGLFDKLVVTDSHPRAVAAASDFVEVHSIAGLLGDYLRANV
jgi:ribose-phosphate pyrophosphokinase